MWWVALGPLRRWPVWAWALATLVASFIRLDYAVGHYSAATGVALLAGSLLGSRAGAASQALALIGLLPLSLLPIGAGLGDWGYFCGQILVAATAGRWAPAASPPRVGWQVGLTLLAMGTAASLAALSWHDRVMGMQLKTYYTAVIGLALFIALWYALRLVQRPTRVLELIASLAPYYALGVLWIAVLRAAGSGAAPAIASTAGNLLFHGYVTHLPGDVLTAVVVAFFADPKRHAAG